MSQVLIFGPGSFSGMLAISCPCHEQGATKFMKQSVSAEQVELKSRFTREKRYVDGPRGMVPMREIEQSETNGVPNHQSVCMIRAVLIQMRMGRVGKRNSNAAPLLDYGAW